MPELSATKRALLVQRLRAKAGGITLLNSEPIAIIGVGCRFPGGATNPARFWEMLQAGRDAITEVPPERWDVEAWYSPDPDAPGKMSTRWGGFLSNIDQFDPHFFSISPREAETMDPQQRLALEVAWEALEHAGLVPSALEGSQTGLFLGISTNDYGEMLRSPTQINPYFGTGNNASVAAARLSYILGWHGPTIAVDTACSSSLYAVHLACQSLHAGESNLALAGGVNIILRPDGMIYFSKLGAMASDGRCKTFDARADGYVRGEGCGFVVLRRLSDALAANDRIIALIRGSAINQDGRSNGLTAPNGPAQEAVIKASLDHAGIDPAQVSYIEAHGTGTALGDPIEVRALSRVLGENRTRPFYLASVKTNLGHTEATAGIAGLIKTALMLHHREIPPHLHFTAPNPHINWDDSPVVIPTERTPWDAPDGPRVAGVSSFGFSGSNAHITLEEAPSADAETVQPAAVHLLTLSARSEPALKQAARAYHNYLTNTETSLAEICAAALLRRTHHEVRLAVTGTDHAAMASKLEAYLHERETPGLVTGYASPGESLPVVFVFPGQGAQWHGMGRQLIAEEPGFLEALQQCEQAFQPYVAWSLIDALNASAEAFTAHPVDVIQPTLFALQVALASLWQAWGIVPDAVMGHSMGEVAAAHVAGLLSLDDAARIICRRSQIVTQAHGGAMAMVELAAAEVETALAPWNGSLSLAAVNGPHSVVVAGEEPAMQAFLTALDRQAIFCRRIKVDYASHCAQMDPLLPELKNSLQGLTPMAGAVTFYSSVHGESIQGTTLDASYWAQNLRQPVLFWNALQRALSEGHRACVEISPHPILLPAVQEGWSDGLVVASLRRNEPERETMLAALGSLHVNGRTNRLYEAAPVLDLPFSAMVKQSYWMHGKTPAPLLPAGTHPLLGLPVEMARPTGLHLWQNTLSSDLLPYLADHRMHGDIVIPGAAYAELALAAAASQSDTVVVEDIQFQRLLFIADTAELQTLITERDNSAMLEIFSRTDGEWTRHATAHLSTTAPTEPSPSLDGLRATITEEISTAEFYASASTTGIELGPRFQGMRQLWHGDGVALAKLDVSAVADPAYHAHPAILDCGFQAMASVALAGDDDGVPFVPTRAARIVWYGSLSRAAFVYANIQGDITFFDDAGTVLLALEQLHFERVETQPRPESWFFGLHWQSQPAPPTEPDASWLILGEGIAADVAADVAAELEATGATVTYATDIKAASLADVANVVYLATFTAPDFAADLLQRQSEAIAQVLALVQALDALESPPRLHLVTADGLATSPLWGLGRTIRHELPSLRCKLIAWSSDTVSLITELQATDSEDQIRLLPGSRAAARLERESVTAEPVVFKPDATYLITGGLGGLGLATAAWMVEHGARHLVLLSRRVPSDLKQLETWAQQGIQVLARPVDVTDADALDACLAEVRATMPPLSGVIHAAGTMDDVTLAQMLPEQLTKVLAPKVCGGWNLHTLTQHDPLDFFVLFSSTAGIMGAPGQGNYAAANAFLDALAHHRRANGQPALSINWGAWADIGLAAAEQNRADRLEGRGVGSIPPEVGVSIFGQLLATDATQMVVLPLDIRRWSSFYPEVREQPLFESLLRAEAPAEAPASIHAELMALDAGSRVERLVQEIVRHVAAVAGVDAATIDPRGALSQLGIDSLMALEMRNRLQASLNMPIQTTVFWRFRTFNDLASHLASKLAPAVETGADYYAQLLAEELALLDDLEDDE